MTSLCPTTRGPAFCSNRVFSTKKRLPSIPSEIETRLWSYVGGIARTNNMKALAVGGMRDHLHLLLSLPPTLTSAKALQLVKAGSSKWMREQGAKGFEWQVGYQVFTSGISQIPGTVNYIRNQDKHHAKRSFAEEWKIFMKRMDSARKIDFSRPWRDSPAGS